MAKRACLVVTGLAAGQVTLLHGAIPAAMATLTAVGEAEEGTAEVAGATVEEEVVAITGGGGGGGHR